MITLKEVIDMYETGHSLGDIARHYNTYPNRIRRMILKSGYKLRSKSEAQKAAIVKGHHPTLGKTLSKETKLKISEAISKSWSNLTNEEREERSEKTRKAWYAVPENKRAEIQRLAGLGTLKAAKEGSSIEHFLLNSLTERGHNVLFHHRGLIKNQDMEVDLFVSNKKAAIEIDGPFHYQALFDHDDIKAAKRIKKKRDADRKKNGMLLSEGFHVIRVKCVIQMNNRRNRLCAEYIHQTLKSLKGEPKIIHLDIEDIL